MDLADRYRRVRRATEELAEPLSAEDCGLQSMPDASPTKWHLGHTTWFFETLVLERALPDFKPFEPAFRVLFNSYYESVGEQHARPERGLLSRPPLERVLAYRRHVDSVLAPLLEEGPDPAVASIVDLGMHHEQQHQELILTDIKHAFSRNPLRPCYRSRETRPPGPTRPLVWHAHPEGLHRIGAPDDGGFAFDNERPRHSVYLEAFELASRPITNGEYLAFVRDGGYETAALWLSDGWAMVRREGWRAPLYWEPHDGEWQTLTLSGPAAVRPDEPVCHVSYFEADAYARWAGARLPTEAEWERAAETAPVRGNLLEQGELHPVPTPAGGDAPAGLFGDVWEWTASAYAPYPGFRPYDGSLAEYNGKFMSGQMVLRGGSCATPASHVRASYRNFFYPHCRWQFSGIRLARDPG